MTRRLHGLLFGVACAALALVGCISPEPRSREATIYTDLVRVTTDAGHAKARRIKTGVQKAGDDFRPAIVLQQPRPYCPITRPSLNPGNSNPLIIA